MNPEPQNPPLFSVDYTEELEYLAWVMTRARISQEAAEAKAAETGKSVSAAFLRIGYQATVMRVRIKQQLAKTTRSGNVATKTALKKRETQPEYSSPQTTVENMSERELEPHLQAAEATRQAIMAQIAALNLAPEEGNSDAPEPEEAESPESIADAMETESAEEAEILRQLYADIHPSDQNAYLGYGADGQVRVFPRLSTLVSPENPQPRPPIEQMRPYLYTLTPEDLTQAEADESVNFLLGILGYPEEERIAG